MFENMRLVNLDMFFNPSFKMTTSFPIAARTTASTRKFINLETFQIIRYWIFI